VPPFLSCPFGSAWTLSGCYLANPRVGVEAPDWGPGECVVYGISARDDGPIVYVGRSRGDLITRWKSGYNAELIEYANCVGAVRYHVLEVCDKANEVERERYWYERLKDSDVFFNHERPK
jgi:hypothetical protein